MRLARLAVELYFSGAVLTLKLVLCDARRSDGYRIDFPFEFSFGDHHDGSFVPANQPRDVRFVCHRRTEHKRMTLRVIGYEIECVGDFALVFEDVDATA